MTENTKTEDYEEPHALLRLLVRSALLGAMQPVIAQDDYSTAKLIQIISAIIVSLMLYGVEKAIYWPVRNKFSFKPLHLATFRGGILVFVLNALQSNDIARALGAAAMGALIAMLLFKLENRLLVKKVVATSENEVIDEK